MWNSLKNKIDGRAKILFLDTEGLISNSNDRTNAKIITLINLISSLFIYNTNSKLDEKGFSDLTFVSQLSSSITVNVSKIIFLIISIFIIFSFSLKQIKKLLSQKVHLNSFFLLEISQGTKSIAQGKKFPLRSGQTIN